MPFLVPIALYGWLILTLIIFTQKKTEEAILFCLIGGTMFLPTVSYNLPLISYGKNTAIALGILLALAIKNNSKKYSIKFCSIDIFVLIWCFFGAISTSIINGLGFYDGLYNSINNSLSWGVFYWLGRKFFSSDNSHKKLVFYIFIGTLIYVPLCLIEIRLSPQLCYWIYGFYPHSFLQHIRRGGFRPMVFMQHGLMVSLWMAAGTIISFTYWIKGTYKKIFNIPIHFLFFTLLITTIITKSSGAAILMLIGLLAVYLYHKKKSTWLIRVLMIFIPLYLALRVLNFISANEVIAYVSQYFSPERIQSLWFRLFQEDLYVQNMSGHMFLGWGGWNRSAPIDPRTERLLIVRDSMWLGFYSEFGLLGLSSVYMILMAGPWKLFKKKIIGKLSTETCILAIIVLLFTLDSLLNSMMNYVYILCAGALVSKAQLVNNKKRTKINP